MEAIKMLLPSRNFFPRSMDLFRDDFFDQDVNIMKADIKTKDGNYIMEIELPGIDKKNITLDYDNGYLTVSATKEEVLEENQEYVHKERYYGSYQRSFYVGDIDEADIKAKYEDGMLKIVLPKVEEIPESKKQITID